MFCRRTSGVSPRSIDIKNEALRTTEIASAASQRNSDPKKAALCSPSSPNSDASRSSQQRPSSHLALSQLFLTIPPRLTTRILPSFIQRLHSVFPPTTIFSPPILRQPRLPKVYPLAHMAVPMPVYIPQEEQREIDKAWMREALIMVSLPHRGASVSRRLFAYRCISFRQKKHFRHKRSRWDACL